MPGDVWPLQPAERDQYVVSRRAARAAPDPWRYQSAFVEDELTAEGAVAPAATVLLTGRECPWRCVMCDLWRHTLEADTPVGAIPSQLTSALADLEPQLDARATVKLYNSGSFFDPRAVPEADYAAVADAVRRFARVIVESHPALIGPRVERLQALLAPAGGDRTGPHLEVAMGLETAHPDALARLHKRMTLESFAAAAGRLARRGVATRVFVLVSPPFVPRPDQDAWLERSVATAVSVGATAISLIPTRPGNGALDAIASHGGFEQPTLSDVERSAAIALAAAGGAARVFTDLWDLARCTACAACLPRRRARLHAMNLEQRVAPRVACAACGAGGEGR